jgi:hypothetical protein
VTQSVIAPGPGDLVDQRLQAVAVRRDQLDRQVGAQEQHDQQRKSDRHEQPLHHRDRADSAQEFGAARGQRIAAQAQLQDRERGGEPQDRKRDFGNHGCCTVPPSFLTSALVMSRISRGT